MDTYTICAQSRTETKIRTETLSPVLDKDMLCLRNCWDRVLCMSGFMQALPDTAEQLGRSSHICTGNDMVPYPQP